MNGRQVVRATLAAFSAVAASAASAQAPEAVPTVNGGDTAWIITASALVLFIENEAAIVGAMTELLSGWS